jgi:hypothetical protein
MAQQYIATTVAFQTIGSNPLLPRISFTENPNTSRPNIHNTASVMDLSSPLVQRQQVPVKEPKFMVSDIIVGTLENPFVVDITQY